MAIYLPSHKLSKKGKQDHVEERINSSVAFSHGHTSVDRPEKKIIFISSVKTLGAIKRTCLVQWLMGTDCEGQRNPCC